MSMLAEAHGKPPGHTRAARQLKMQVLSRPKKQTPVRRHHRGRTQKTNKRITLTYARNVPKKRVSPVVIFLIMIRGAMAGHRPALRTGTLAPSDVRLETF